MKRTGKIARKARPASGQRERDRANGAASSAVGFWRLALFVAAVALIFRLVHLFQIRNEPFFELLMGDAQSYESWARRIASGDWIGRDVFYQAPLYPYFLSGLFVVFGHSLLAVKVCQSVAGSVACGALAVATARLFGRRAGLFAGLLLAVYPPAIFFDGLIQKTTLDGFFLCVLLLAIVWANEERTARSGLMAGVALGCLALTRENALAFVPLVAAWLWLRDRRAPRPLLAFVLGIACVISPVALRNFTIDGALHLTTSQFGPNLYIGNSPAANGAYVPLRADHSTPEFERQDATELAEQATGHRLTAGEVSTYWRDRAVEWIVSHPGAWLRLTGRKLMLAWNVVEPADTEDIYTYAARSWPLWPEALLNFGVLAPLGLLGIWMTRDRWRELWLFHAMGLVYTATVVLFYVFARYRYPLAPLLAMFAGAALAGLPAWWTRQSLRERAIAGSITVGAILLCHWPLQSPEAMQSVTHYNIAYALQAQQHVEEAMAEYRTAIAHMPGNGAAHANLGVLLTERGEHREAVNHLTEAVRLEPLMASARTNLGIALAAESDLPSAMAHFEQALRLDPGDVRAHYNLAIALASEGNVASAIQHLRAAVGLQPAYADAQNNLGVLLSMSGALQEALEHFAAAVSADPSNAGYQANLTRARESMVTQRPSARIKK